MKIKHLFKQAGGTQGAAGGPGTAGKESSDMRTIRRHIWFSGRVQGVGFRYRSLHIAELYGLTGWVRNDWDGRVEMELQGCSEDIEKMIAQLNEDRYIIIEHYEVSGVPVLQEEHRFSVRSS